MVYSRDLLPYSFHDSLGILQSFMVPESQHSKPRFFQHIGSDSIFRLILLMLSPVQFNYDFFLKTDKIENIIPKRMLSSKFYSI